MPSLSWPFPNLLALLECGTYVQQFYGIDYYLAGNNGYIEDIIPASEYYKFAFRHIADKHFSLHVSSDKIKRLQSEIELLFKHGRTVLPATDQPSFAVHNQVYSLKGELGNLFFTSRSIMDSSATLMHFLYGPSSSPFSSFSDFKKYIYKKIDQATGHAIDEPMKHFIENNMAWFDRLKDIRDYVTHYKSINISFYEQNNGEIKTYLEDRFEMSEFVESVQTGISDYLLFIDQHFTRRISAATAGP